MRIWTWTWILNVNPIPFTICLLSKIDTFFRLCKIIYVETGIPRIIAKWIVNILLRYEYDEIAWFQIYTHRTTANTLWAHSILSISVFKHERSSKTMNHEPHIKTGNEFSHKISPIKVFKHQHLEFGIPLLRWPKSIVRVRVAFFCIPFWFYFSLSLRKILSCRNIFAFAPYEVI